MKVQDLPTPALLVDADAFERNVASMSLHAKQAGKRLRPHGKAHKCVEVAKRQMAAGAVGVCAATVSEAELFARAGIGSILLTSPVADAGKMSRIAALGSQVAVIVDCTEQVRLYERAAKDSGVVLEVLVDLDTGDHRSGALPGVAALQLAREITASAVLRFGGLQAYSVRASHLASTEGRDEFTVRCWGLALETRDLLVANGIPVVSVTGGSTGSFSADCSVAGVTELQAGSYVFMDSAYGRIGGIPFENAMSVMATVVSATHEDRITVDAGFKAFSTDRPFPPDVIGLPGTTYSWAGDEFGYVHWNGSGHRLRVGERIRFIPPHCDPTVNLYDRIYVCRGDVVEDVWPVMTGSARPSDRIAGLKPTAVNAVLAEVRALPAQNGKPVSLMRGEPDFATPAHIVEAAERALRAGRTGYADNRGEPGLRAALAEKLDGRYNAGTEILITDGATLGVYAALMTLLAPGDDILLPDPVYDAYQSPVRLAGGNIRRVRSTVENGRFRLTREALEAAVTPRAQVLLLNTPWNPVGTVFTEAELKEIAEFVEAHHLTLISDEIYEEITYEPARHISPAGMLRDRCVVVNSFSKSYAMPGWRLGYCAASKERIAAMLLVLQQSSRGPATFVQDAGEAALTGPQDCVAEMRREYASRRSLTIDALSGIPRVRVLPPEGGFFAMVDVREIGFPSDAIRKRLLQEHRVVVMHGSAYGEGGEGTLRVSFASGGENLRQGLEMLRAGLLAL